LKDESQLATLARELGIMVVSDEVYRWSVFGSNPFVPMGKFSSIVPVITLGSISKGWIVPGWRTGWLALHDLNGVFRSTKVPVTFFVLFNIDIRDMHRFPIYYYI